MPHVVIHVVQEPAECVCGLCTNLDTRTWHNLYTRAWPESTHTGQWFTHMDNAYVQHAHITHIVGIKKIKNFKSYFIEINRTVVLSCKNRTKYDKIVLVGSSEKTISCISFLWIVS